MNEQHSPLTWFITGVSRGLGRALAERALERGDTVVGTIRQASQRAAFEALAPGRALAYELDVTDGAAIDDVVARAVGAVGHVDVVVNNAGYGQIGTLEASSEAEARHQFEVNVFGALRVTQAFLPHFRSRRRGHFLQISSVGGMVGFAGVGLYNASKFALEGFSEALANESADLGIKVTIVEPGAFRTDWAGDSLRTADDHADYISAGSRIRAIHGQQIGDPRRAAEAMLRVVDAPTPPLRLVLGADALQAIRSKLATMTAELDRWEAVTVSTAFPDAPPAALTPRGPEAVAAS